MDKILNMGLERNYLFGVQIVYKYVILIFVNNKCIQKNNPSTYY